MTKFRHILEKYNPVLPRTYLLAMAGLMWSAVGFLLLRYAFLWLFNPLTWLHALLGLLGLGLSIAASRLQFSKLARKNIRRILALPGRACLFSFQAWKGYLIIAVMMTGGIMLRSSSLPRPALAVVYATIGGALLLASLEYYTRLAEMLRPEPEV